MAAASTTNAIPEEYLCIALESHPEIAEARAEVQKSSAVVRLAKANTSLRSKPSPATVTISPPWPEISAPSASGDGRRQNSAKAKHRSQLAQTKENLESCVQEKGNL